MERAMGSMSLALLLAGCATAYQPLRLDGGYSEIRLNGRAFRVSFKGNFYTGQERLGDYVLLRGAELALEHGCPHFVLVDEKLRSESSGRPVYGGGIFSLKSPSAHATILCHEHDPSGDELVYDAAMTSDSITKKYRIRRDPPARENAQAP